MRKNIVVKDWGWEEIVENNDLYCLKIITCVDHRWSSKGKYHYHRKKDETFWIKDGILELDIQQEDGTFSNSYLREGESVRIRPGIKHKFRSVHNKCVFVEASTHHSDSDSIRCQYVVDDKLGRWVEDDSPHEQRRLVVEKEKWDKFKKVMDELQNMWANNIEEMEYLHTIPQGMRSTQVATLVLYLMEKGVI